MVLLLKMENFPFFFFFFFFFLAFAGFLNAQKVGFLSIDCGIPQGSNYTDEYSGIFYISDADFIHAGANKEIQANLKDDSLARQFHNVRSFPEGGRNCYTLPVAKGSKYLVRGAFMYGNYDGEDEMPNFDLYLGVNLWTSINQANGSRPGWTEIILIATEDYIPVCLVRKKGNPYISGLELRQIDFAMYNATDDVSTALVLYNRYDLGSAITGRIPRYGNDVYDRIWSPFNRDTWTILSTTSAVKNSYNVFQPPPPVMNTAVTPANGSNVIHFNWTASSADEQYVVYRHFSELSILKDGDLREFDICVVGFPSSCLNQFRPAYLVADTVYTVVPFSGRIDYSCSFTSTNASTLPPILNAIEIYTVTKLSETATNNKDVDAIMDIKTTYQIERNWMGDPCVPQNYSWEGLNCSYDTIPPTIISLNLASSKLEGSIAPSIQNLTSLKSLDLSGNNLTGEVPSFLATLQSLRFLNLYGNQLNGSVPTALQERKKNGSLQLSIDKNPDLCTSDSCNKSDTCTTNPCELKKERKKWQIAAPIIIAASLVTIALFVVAFISWRKRGNRKPQVNKSYEVGGGSFNLESRRFTFAEIVSMTNNFQRTLGKGGFGVVYHGQMNDGTQVAVKMVSQTGQGFNEFQIEAQLLTRFYHKHLVQFIGYCAEGNNMALVLEYMSEGNLAKVLAGKSNQNPLNWGQRLQIALAVAQGLEYLHKGCKPPIIHRDVKATNNLLNKKLEAKIADFGLSKVFHDDDLSHVSTAVKGTHGYLDPEYCISNNVNEKSDVYSFGIVLMELITGQPAIIQTSRSDLERIGIMEYVSPQISRGDISNVVDARLQGIYDTNSAWTVIEIAIACASHKSIQRPTMSNVVAELKGCMGVQRAVSENVSFTREGSPLQSNDSSIFRLAPR